MYACIFVTYLYSFADTRLSASCTILDNTYIIACMIHVTLWYKHPSERDV